MERCPSGLRCMIGNHVAGEYRHGGSNPPLSATNVGSVRNDRALLLCLFSGGKRIPNGGYRWFHLIIICGKTAELHSLASNFKSLPSPVAELKIRYIM